MSAVVGSELYAAISPHAHTKTKPELYAAITPYAQTKTKPELYAAMIPFSKAFVAPVIYASIIPTPTVKLAIWHDGKPYTCKLDFDEVLLNKILGGI